MSQPRIAVRRLTPGALIDAVDDWFTTREPNAAGRLGLFRILYAAFYFWTLSSQKVQQLTAVPADHRRRVVLIELLPTDPPALFFDVIELSLVAALALLLVGFRVRLATLAVLTFGMVLESYWVSLDAEHATVFLTFFIPFFMLLGGAKWGETYSVDALLRRTSGARLVERADASWVYFLPARGILVVLAVLFVSSALFKVSGTWISYPLLLANELLQKNIEAALMGLPLNPLAPAVAERPWLGESLRWPVLLFEGTFFLALLSRGLRALYVAVALIFHSVNALWLAITFTPVLIVYGLFVDWQALTDCFTLKTRVTPIRTRQPPAWALVVTSLLFTVGTVAFWNHGLKNFVTLDGQLDWRTVWYPVLPLATVWLVAVVARLAKRDTYRSAHTPCRHRSRLP